MAFVGVAGFEGLLSSNQGIDKKEPNLPSIGVCHHEGHYLARRHSFSNRRRE
jgi:hypothetical protein